MQSPPSFSPREFTELYVQGAFDELSERFLVILRYVASNFYEAVDSATQQAIDAFVLNFLHLFAQPDYVPNRQHGIEFIEHNGTIANLAALSAIIVAQRTARAGPSNVARNPSPRFFTSRPRNRDNWWRTISSWRSSNARHARSPNAAACFVESTTSVKRTVASTRSISVSPRDPVKNSSISPTSRSVSPIAGA